MDLTQGNLERCDTRMLGFVGLDVGSWLGSSDQFANGWESPVAQKPVAQKPVAQKPLAQKPDPRSQALEIRQPLKQPAESPVKATSKKTTTVLQLSERVGPAKFLVPEIAFSNRIGPDDFSVVGLKFVLT